MLTGLHLTPREARKGASHGEGVALKGEIEAKEPKGAVLTVLQVRTLSPARCCSWGCHGLCITGDLLLTPAENFLMKCCLNGNVISQKEKVISYGKVSLKFVPP